MYKINSVQALRFFAATLVIVCHAFDPAKFGAVGVDIFFVISGFIIGRAMVGKSASAFFKARLIRIYPIYWICAIPTAILASQIGATNLSRTLTSITLWPVFGKDFLQPYLVIGWTLSFEMLFYACVALTLLKRRLAVVFLLGWPLALAAAFLTDVALLRFIGSPLILEFLSGVLISRLETSRPRPVAGVTLIGLGILIIALSDTQKLYLPLNTFELVAPERALIWGAVATLIFLGFLQLEKINWGILPYLGDASYSIYLAHGSALLLAAALPWQLQVIFAVVFGVGVYRYIEQPVLDFLRRKFTRVSDLKERQLSPQKT